MARTQKTEMVNKKRQTWLIEFNMKVTQTLRRNTEKRKPRRNLTFCRINCGGCAHNSMGEERRRKKVQKTVN